MEVRSEEGELIRLPCRARELLAYLLIQRQPAYSREAVSAVLWNDASASQAKKYLRQALWQLNDGLNFGAPRKRPPLLQLERDWLEIHPDAGLGVDIQQFDQTCRSVRDLPGTEFSAAHAQASQSAVDLYRGELLSGCYREWCLVERERLQALYLSLLDKLVDYSAGQYRFDEGIAYAMRAFQIEPTRETTHRRLMRLHARAGDRAAAMLQYQRCKEALKRDLGVEPSDRTRSVWAWIRDDHGLGKSARTASDHSDACFGPLRQQMSTVVDVDAASNLAIDDRPSETFEPGRTPRG